MESRALPILKDQGTDRRRLRAGAGTVMALALGATGLTACLLSLRAAGVVLVDDYQGDGLWHILVFHAVLASAAGLLWGTARQRTKRTAWAGRLVFASLPLLVLISCDRWALLIVRPAPMRDDPLFTPHPIRKWSLSPGARLPLIWGADTINEYGMRGPRIGESPAPDELRVALVGDSVVFGAEHPYPLTVSPQLERYAAAMKFEKKLVVINLGVPGYAPWQLLDYLREVGMRFHPSVVVYVFCLNDVTDRARCAALREAPLTTWQRRAEASGLFRLGRELVARRSPIDARAWYAHLSDACLIDDVPSDLLAQAWDQYLSDVDALASFVLGQDLRFLIAMVPCAPQLRPGVHTEALPQRRLKNHAQVKGYDLLDLLPVLRDEGGFDSFGAPLTFEDKWHLTPLGHQLVGRELAEALTVTREKHAHD